VAKVGANSEKGIANSLQEWLIAYRESLIARKDWLGSSVWR
jgi:hypothetical protein